jgi:GMP synthase (glutamine-hydrolysing)
VRVLAVVHQRDAPAGVFGEAVAAAGHELDVWVPAEDPPPPRSEHGAVMVFGGAMNPDEGNSHPWLDREKRHLRELLDARVPVLGVCLGFELVAEAAGAPPRRAARPEIGWHALELLPAAAADPLLAPLPDRVDAFQWHSYEAPLPPCAVALAHSSVCLQAFRLSDRPAWGMQFHAEVTEEIVGWWLDDHTSDPDAAGLDVAGVRAQTAERIGAWSELGRGICTRFVEYAAGLSAA